MLVLAHRRPPEPWINNSPMRLYRLNGLQEKIDIDIVDIDIMSVVSVQRGTKTVLLSKSVRQPWATVAKKRKRELVGEL